jgi:TolB-like protein
VSLIAELKRRKVFKVGVAYLVVAWLAVQAASIAFPAFEAPPWALRVFIFVSLLGFPIALVASWALENTSDGLRVDPAGIGSKRIFAIAGLLVVLAVAWYFKGQPSWRAAGSGPRALAVLPFASLGQDADSSGMAGGLHDTLITQLSKLKGLEVRSRTSVMKYKDWNGGLKPIARELGVAVVLEGSVQHHGNRTVVNAQLIDALTDAHLWAETFDRTGDDLFALQAEIAQKVAESLSVALSPEERKVLTEAPTENREAYALYIEGRRLVTQGEGPLSNQERENVRQRGTALLESAVAKDPRFALAWSSLARAYASTAWDTSTGDYRAFADQARRAAERAIAFGADLPEAHFARGTVALQLDFDFPLALRELEVATSAAPGIAEFQSRLCVAYRYSDRFEDSARSCRKALALDPTEFAYAANLRAALIRLRRMDEVLALARESAALQPGEYYAASLPAKYESMMRADMAPLANYLRTLDPKLRKGPDYHHDAWDVGVSQGDYAASLAALDAPHEELDDVAGFQRGDVLRWSGRDDDARAAYAASRDERMASLAGERDPYVEAIARAQLAQALGRLGDAAGARENIAKAEQLWGYAREPSDGAHTWFSLLPAHIALGDFNAACAKVKVLVEGPTEYPAGRIWLSGRLAELHRQPCFRALMQANGVDVNREPFAMNRAVAAAPAP